MNCAVHSEVPAQGFCRNCGKAMCEVCKRDVRGILYCEDCLATTVSAPVATAASGPSPALAAVLGIVPGLGAVYNGEYMKALIHVLIFGTIIAMLDQSGAEGFFVPLLIAFILYMPIEAYQTAKARLHGRTPTTLFGDVRGGQPIGAYVLIGLGILYLVQQSGVPVFSYIGRFIAPILLIGLGLYLIRRQTGGGRGAGGNNAGTQP
ncbi:MAG: B-box zinc finger protein [Candidatus Acidiferrales bacterium]